MASTHFKSNCPYCGVGCRITAKVENETILKISADKADLPNLGNLCQKGQTLDKTIVPDSRLTHPLLRKDKASPLVLVSWEEAISFATRRLKETLATRGKGSVSFYGSGQLDTEASYLFTKLFKGSLGINHMDTNSRLCMASAATAYRKAFGSDGPPCSYEDFDQADIFLIVGSNLAVNHPVLFQRLRRRKIDFPDTRTIVLDPRATPTARFADLHVGLAPGSDVAFLSLVAKRLVEAGHYSRKFTRHYATGFAAFVEGLKAIDEDQYLRICDVKKEILDQVVLMIRQTGRLLSLYCQGTNQSTHGVDNNLAIINLHLLLGEVGKTGSGPFSLTGQPNAMGGRETGYLSHQLPGYRFVASDVDRKALENFWKLPPGHIESKPGYTATEMFQKGAEGEIDFFWIACTNPVVTMSDLLTTQKALRLAKTVVVSDVFLSAEILDYADVVFPAATWSEKTGTMTNSERLVSRSQAYLTPPGEAKPDWEIVRDFGQALGFEGYDFKSSDEVWSEYIGITQGRPCDQSGMTNLRLKQGPLYWPCRSESDPGQERLYLDRVFNTPDGKANFFPLTYKPPQELSRPGAPFLLTTGRVGGQWHTRTRSGLVPELNLMDGEAYVQIHPSDAERLYIEDNELIVLSNDRGEVSLKAHVTKETRRGLLFAPFHWGEEPTQINRLFGSFVDPESKQPELKCCAVQISKA